MPHEFDAFLSYAGEDAEFARWLTGKLQSAGFRIWFAEEMMPAGVNINEELRKITRSGEVRHGIFVMSESWLEKEAQYTGWEAKLLSSNGDRKLIAVVRDHLDSTALGPGFHGGKYIDWPAEEDSPLERLWELFCGLTGESPGPKKNWAAKAESMLGSAVADDLPRRETSMRPTAVDPSRLLALNRDPQWGKLERLATDSAHQAIFLVGPERQGHKLFLDRVEDCLTREPRRRMVEVPWERPPGSKGAAIAMLARGLECGDGEVVKKIEALLHSQNLVLVHRPVFEETTVDYLLLYYREWLPSLLGELPRNARHSVKMVHALRWPESPPIVRGWQRLTAVVGNKNAQRRLEKYAAAQQFIDELRKARPPTLAVHFLDTLQPVTHKHIEEWVVGLGLDDQRRKALLEVALDGNRDTVDVVRRVRERLNINRRRNHELRT